MNAVKATLESVRSRNDRSQRKDPAQVAYLVGEILATCRDSQSRGYYTKIARELADETIFRFLAEVRQDPSIRNRGAVFTAKVKRYLQDHGSKGSWWRKIED